jgi:hypothetical protein
MLICTPGLAVERLGVGVILGEPTGLSMKYWLNDTNAIDGAAAWSFSDRTSFQLHGDYLWHDYDLIDPAGLDGRLPVYYGVGARLRFHEHRRNSNRTVFGIRVPVGISYLFADAPFDLFGEIVPILDVAPDTRVRLNGAVGARFYFR